MKTQSCQRSQPEPERAMGEDGAHVEVVVFVVGRLATIKELLHAVIVSIA